ncbi:unnamed protein product, partial [Ectocarpus sp. 8 AP-2014]
MNDMIDHRERSRCLDAFIVALSQACEGGGKQWYASTLELQVTSLDFCRACRSVPTLEVSVDEHTPRSLWAPNTTQTRPIIRNSKVARISSRVPVVRAAGLTWGLLFEVLLESIAMELWGWSNVLRLRGPVDSASLVSVTWPPRLKLLSFGDSFNQPIAGVAWPASLQQLSFGDDFNQPIAGVAWPASLQQLSFGVFFNQPIAGVLWPASLQQLWFDNDFDQPIAGVAWPASLQELSFGELFD